ncbi:hypothetical protein B0I22_0493 [Epilithonimonas xixisoli]|uniref:Uncharacterized protein n=1 Tax=Epilithonimonas xixisoli TaxID=1476462 RepID=A0A4R8IHM0_9FLAO|nr:hypothetical protein B0I22_0493 [Epilithonimonas xixisoli]
MSFTSLSQMFIDFKGIDESLICEPQNIFNNYQKILVDFAFKNIQ